MLERPQTGILQKKEIPAILNAMGQGRDSLAMDGITPSFALNFAEGGSIRNQAATATFTRATTATVVDHDSIVRTVLSGEARMQGLRRVRNLMTNTEDFVGAWSATTCTITPGVLDPLGGTTAGTITSTATSVGTAAFQQIGGMVASQKFMPSCWLKRRTGTGRVDLRTSDNVAYTITSSLTTSWQRFSAPVAGPSGANAFFVLSVQVSGDAVDIWHPQLEDVTGQAVQNPGEYVSTGVVSSPFHGANVDSVKYFPTHNGNVVQQNMLPRSQQFDTAPWADITGNPPVVTPNTTIAPDGTLTATTLADNNAAAFTGRRQVGIVVASATDYTFSIYVKKTSGGTSPTFGLNLAFSGSSTVFNYYPRLNTDTGVTGTQVGSVAFKTLGAVDAGNYWRFFGCANSGSGNTAVSYELYGAVSTNGSFSDDPTATGSAIIWGAQLQPGRRAGTYVPTTTVAINNNIVEEGASNFISASTRLGYLSEGARTNICLRSENLAGTWVPSNTTVDPDQTAGADGVVSADRLNDTASNTNHDINQTFVKAASALPYAFSVYVKAGTKTSVLLNTFDTTNGAFTSFNLSTGAIIDAATGFGASPFTSLSNSITALANGWYRCELRFTTGTSTSLTIGVRITNSSYLGDGLGNIYVWGAQLEQAAFSSTYIPTTTVSVTRNADVLSYPTTAWLNTVTGTWFAQLQETSGSGADVARKTVIATGSGTGAWPIYELWSGAGVTFVADLFDGTTEITGGGAFTPGTTKKIANAYGGATAIVARDAVLGIATAFDGVMNDSGTLSVSSRNDGTTPYFGTLSNIKFYPRRLTDAQLQSITR